MADNDNVVRFRRPGKKPEKPAARRRPGESGGSRKAPGSWLSWAAWGAIIGVSVLLTALNQSGMSGP